MPIYKYLHTKMKNSTLLTFLALVVVTIMLPVTSYLIRATTSYVSHADTPTSVVFHLSGNGSIANQDGTSYSTSAQMVWLGTGKNATTSYAGFLFTGAIPQGATITSASLDVTSPQWQWIPLSIDIGAESSANPTSFSQTALLSTRPLITPIIHYADNVSWSANSSHSFDVTSLIKSVYTSSPSQQTISIIVHGNGNAYGRKFIYSSGTNAPRLTIMFSGGSTVSPTRVPTPTMSMPTMPMPSGTPAPSPTGMPGMGDASGNSAAMGLWTPNPKYDTCPQSLHDSYKVKGPDGKWYPTWHPPTTIDPATGKTCTFGHEHGRDPHGSNLYAWAQQVFAYNGDTADSGLPFGYANEQLDAYNAANGITNGMRHEDHVGHKIEWENNVPMDYSTVVGGSGRTPANFTCDFLFKIHQGTHSKDAFTNNLHELEYLASCSDGTKAAATIMVAFGKPGTFSEGGFAGGFNTITVGTATPTNSPTGAGLRSLPTINRILQNVLVPSGQFSQLSLGLYEDWVSGNHITTKSGQEILYYDPHFAVFSPSRFYWPGNDTNTYGITRTPDDIAANVGRSTDVCWMTNGANKAHVGECDGFTNYGQIKTPIPYDDPRSPFNGVHREMYFNNTNISNAGGPTVWYTDPFGHNAQTTPFPGSIRQYIASVTTKRPYPLESQAIGGNRYYGGNGVHAPN